jgi:hypothetical protein
VCLQLSTVLNDDGLSGGTRLRSDGLALLDHIETIDDTSKDDVLSVEPAGLLSADEELRSVGCIVIRILYERWAVEDELTVGSGVGHGQSTGSLVLSLEVLVGELLSVDGLATSSISLGEVTSLAHELGDDSVELAALEVEGLAGLAGSLLTSAESSEVLGGLGDYIGVEL